MLTEIIVNHATEPDVRAEALRTLRRVPSNLLQNDDTVRRLMAAYGDLRGPEEKRDLLVIVHAWSPRSLPFHARILGTETDENVRQLAASSLASWNVRRGVAGLVGILEDCNEDASIDRAACNEAAKSFSWLNRHKGWGFAEAQVRDEILSRRDISNEEMSAAFVLEIKKWFAENEHRFPDWKPGDPLPEAVPSDSKGSPQK